MVDDIRQPKREGPPVDIQSNNFSAEPKFTPPEVIAQDEEVVDMAEAEGQVKGNKKQPETPDPKKPFQLKTKLKDLIIDIKLWWNDRSKKQKIIIAAASVLLVAALGTGGFLLFHKPKPAAKPAPIAAKKEEVKEAPKPTTEPSHLTGVQVPPEYNLLPVTGVMIENSPDARPQAGLISAGVVFEAVAEGGITRFLALYQEDQPDYVGPVRSVRPYYLQWLQAFDAAIAHVGGSPDALGYIKSQGIKDLDQFYNGGAYQRITQRYAPHNVYTSIGSLIALQKSKGFTSNFTGFARKADKPAATTTARVIEFAISGPLYNAHFDYDAPTNSYVRSEGGQAHKDERTGKIINPKVVIAIMLPQGIAGDGLHTTYNTIGSGTAYIFQDGTATQGTWSKSSDKDQFHFGDANGSPIGLNAGQTWISVVSAPGSVASIP